MNFIDFILNIVGLLLWINGRTAWVIKRRRTGISISGAIKRTDPLPGSEWTSTASLLTMLIFRAFFYWNLGPLFNWTPTINLVPVSLSMRSDLFPLALLYSFTSFGLTFCLFYSWLLLLSAINMKTSPDDVIHRFVRMQLGVMDRFPAILKLSMPILAAGLAWLAAAPVLQHYGILPPPASKLHLVEQSLVIGLSAILVYRGILVFILGVHILNTYIFLGDHPFWDYVRKSAHRLLGPLKDLKVRYLDIGSLLVLSTVLVLSHLFSTAFFRLFATLPW